MGWGVRRGGGTKRSHRGDLGPLAADVLAWFGTGRNAARRLAAFRPPGTRWPPVPRLAAALLAGSDRADRTVGLHEAQVVRDAWDAYRRRTFCRPDHAGRDAYLPYVKVPRPLPKERRRSVRAAVLEGFVATFGTRGNALRRLGLADNRRWRGVLRGRPLPRSRAAFIEERIATLARCHLARAPWS